jgi:hypothetical protein
MRIGATARKGGTHVGIFDLFILWSSAIPLNKNRKLSWQCSERSSDRFHILALAIARNIFNEN